MSPTASGELSAATGLRTVPVFDPDGGVADEAATECAFWLQAEA